MSAARMTNVLQFPAAPSPPPDEDETDPMIVFVGIRRGGGIIFAQTQNAPPVVDKRWWIDRLYDAINELESEPDAG